MKNTFFHGEIKEEIYMDVLLGFCEKTGTNTLCKLRKYLYGLKQSPQAWFGRLIKVMVSLNFKQRSSYPIYQTL